MRLFEDGANVCRNA